MDAMSARRSTSCASSGIGRRRDRPAMRSAHELEKLETDEPRWSQRLGEALRRLGKTREAEEAFVRATERYVKRAFCHEPSDGEARRLAQPGARRSPRAARDDQARAAAPSLPWRGREARSSAAVLPPPCRACGRSRSSARTTRRSTRLRFSDVDGPSSLDIVMDDFESAVVDDIRVVSVVPSASVVTRAPGAAPEMREPSIDRLGAMATFRLFAGLSREALLDLSTLRSRRLIRAP